MTIPLPVGPLTPYLTPELLTAAPTGISWATIPPGAGVTAAQRNAEQLNMCMRATSEIDGYCNMVMRATVDTEYRTGPDFYMTIQQATGNARIILYRKPILNINSIQVSPNIFPRQYVTVPQGFYAVEYPGIGFYGTNAPSSASESGQSIILSAGYVSWANGRNGYVAQVQYVNGFPHTSLTQNIAAGVTSIPVDDCTGWAPFGSNTSLQSGNSTQGCTGVFYDSGFQEVVQITASSAATGPGNLTISSPTQFAHQAGVMLSTMPGAFQQAAIYLCAAYALTRGATSTTVHQIPGGGGGGGGDVNSPPALIKRAWMLLEPFKRTI